MIIPDRLKPGDIVAIITPSSMVADMDRLKKGIDFLESLGLLVRFGRYFNCQSPYERALDIHLHLKDSEVRGIIAAAGGDSIEDILPMLDWGLIAANPKIFVGYSDVTAFLNAIYQKTGLVTYHGKNIAEFYKGYSDYERIEFHDRLFRGLTGPVRHNSLSKTIRRGQAEGRLLGGNFRCLLKLEKVGFMPDFTGAILMLEAYSMDEEKALKYLDSLRRLGILDVINGMLIGYIFELVYRRPKARQLEDIILEYTHDYNFPILKTGFFGHNCPNTILPIGCMVKLDTDRKILYLYQLQK